MDAHLALKSERERQGKTAAAAAVYLGVSEDMVRRYDSGRSDIGLRQAARYAEFLGKQLGDVLPSSQVRSGDLHTFIMALEDFEPRERPLMVEKATRDLSFLSARMNDRELRRSADRPMPANVLEFPPVTPTDMTDQAMRRLTEVMKEAGFPPRKAAIGHEYAVRFFGSVSAGEGVEIFDDSDVPEEYRQIPSWAYKKGARGIFKVVGWSMLDMGIADGQILFVKPTPEPANGETVICRLNRKAFVKKLRRDSRGLPSKLIPKAPGYPEIDIGPNDEIEFYGVAIGNTGDL